jgi:hypothetical protein
MFKSMFKSKITTTTPVVDPLAGSTGKGIRPGNKVRDTISGVEGIVLGRFEYMYGCVRCEVQPEGTDKDGKVHDGYVFDEQRLELVATPPITVSKDATPGKPPGGPRPTPSRHRDPVR